MTEQHPDFTDPIHDIFAPKDKPVDRNPVGWTSRNNDQNRTVGTTFNPDGTLSAYSHGVSQGDASHLFKDPQGTFTHIADQNGVKQPFFDITAAKSEAGVRRVPVRSEPVWLGILKYVKAIGSGPLFPGIMPGGPDRKRGHTFAKRFPALRREKGVERERIAFHSFRKNFVRALELAKVIGTGPLR